MLTFLLRPRGRLLEILGCRNLGYFLDRLLRILLRTGFADFGSGFLGNLVRPLGFADFEMNLLVGDFPQSLVIDPAGLVRLDLVILALAESLLGPANLGFDPASVPVDLLDFDFQTGLRPLRPLTDPDYSVLRNPQNLLVGLAPRFSLLLLFPAGLVVRLVVRVA